MNWLSPVFITGLLSFLGVIGAAFFAYKQGTKAAERAGTASVEVARTESKTEIGLHVFDSEREALSKWVKCEGEKAEVCAKLIVSEAETERLKIENGHLRDTLQSAGLAKYLEDHMRAAAAEKNHSALVDLKQRLDEILDEHKETPASN